MRIFFPYEIGRIQFLIRNIILVIFGSFVATYIWKELGDPPYVFLLWFCIYCAYGVFGLMLPRIRNAGYPARYLWWVLVPFANLWIGYILYFLPAPENKGHFEKPQI
jgi:hypothetical protein